MSEPSQLSFGLYAEQGVRLPTHCSIATACYEAQECRHAVAAAMEQVLFALAFFGIDLRALDGITMAQDCREAAIALQNMPQGQAPLEMTAQPGTLEMARTVAVWRERELRFHIVLQSDIGLMVLSTETHVQTVAHACIAHEAAHVEHEGHLYRTLPGIYGCPLECGERSRQTFLKAMDVWSEYAACRTSAPFRPEAVEEFEAIFCRALEDGLSVGEDRIVAFRNGLGAPQMFREIQQLFGDVFVLAGYFLGHLDGLELDVNHDAPRVGALLRQHPQIQALLVRLRRTLQELWLSESNWQSIDVFAPIYDLICCAMAMHGVVFARNQDEWQLVLSEPKQASSTLHKALAAWLARQGKAGN